jgi:hypothetical protein
MELIVERHVEKTWKEVVSLAPVRMNNEISDSAKANRISVHS